MNVNQLWFRYNEYSNKLHNKLGRASNIVGEYAEYLSHQHYGGKLLTASTSSADLEVSIKMSG
jgi:hypothetical protein